MDICAHTDFSIGVKEKQTRTTFKNINFVLFRMSRALKVPYTSYIVTSTEPFFFSG